MRMISEHKVNPANDRINIAAVDDVGPGGANHVYEVTIPETGKVVTLSFQNGPINEAGVNGVTHEVLLAIVADRMRSFQSGPYSCRENALALTKIEEAMHWLHSRTLARMQRGVEGTHKL
jgi:hypothetical protein